MKVILNEEGGVYQPYATISGQVTPFITEAVELVLFWYTKGLGTEDVEIVERKELNESVSNQFSFTLPDEPYSMSGKLISVIWAIELVDAKNKAIDRREFVVSPTGEEMVLTAVEEPESGGRMNSRFKRLAGKLDAQSKK